MPNRAHKSHWRQLRETIIERGRADVPTMPAIPPRLVDAIQAEKAAATLRGERLPRELQAIVYKDEVVRMSAAGASVKQIAVELGLSYGHVVALRAQLGISRRRS